MKPILAAAAALLATPLAAQEVPPAPGALLQAMAQVLISAERFSFHVEKTFDEVLVDGSTIELGGGLDVAVARPQSLYVSYGTDLESKQAWYDGSGLTLVDHRARLHGRIDVSGPLTPALDGVAARYDLRMPLADLISDDLDEVLAGLTVDAVYLGVHDVEGAPSHHVLIRGEERHAQLWIDAGEAPLLNKLVLTDMTQPARPRTAFVFSDWDLDAAFPEDLFEAETPEGYARAAFLGPEG